MRFSQGHLHTHNRKPLTQLALFYGFIHTPPEVHKHSSSSVETVRGDQQQPMRAGCASLALPSVESTGYRSSQEQKKRGKSSARQRDGAKKNEFPKGIIKYETEKGKPGHGPNQLAALMAILLARPLEQRRNTT